MVPMTMRSDHSFDTAKINAQSRTVVFNCEFDGAGVEKDRVDLGTSERFDDKRQSMIGAALHLPDNCRMPARINAGHSSVTFGGALDRLSVTLSIRI